MKIKLFHALKIMKHNVLMLSKHLGQIFVWNHERVDTDVSR